MKIADLQKLKAVPVLTVEDLFKHEVLVSVTFNKHGGVASRGSPYKAIRLSDINEKGEPEKGVVTVMYETVMFYDDRYITGLTADELFMNPIEHGVSAQTPETEGKMVFGMNTKDFTRFDDGVVSTLHWEQVQNWRKIGERLNASAEKLGLSKRVPIF